MSNKEMKKFQKTNKEQKRFENAFNRFMNSEYVAEHEAAHKTIGELGEFGQFTYEMIDGVPHTIPTNGNQFLAVSSKEEAFDVACFYLAGYAAEMMMLDITDEDTITKIGKTIFANPMLEFSQCDDALFFKLYRRMFNLTNDEIAKVFALIIEADMELLNKYRENYTANIEKYRETRFAA